MADTVVFKQNELFLIADLLDAAADSFSNNSCNDYDVAETFPTKAQRLYLRQEIAKYYDTLGDEESSLDDDSKTEEDWQLMRFFAMKLRDKARNLPARTKK